MLKLSGSDSPHKVEEAQSIWWMRHRNILRGIICTTMIPRKITPVVPLAAQFIITMVKGLD